MLLVTDAVFSNEGLAEYVREKLNDTLFDALAERDRDWDAEGVCDSET